MAPTSRLVSSRAIMTDSTPKKIVPPTTQRLEDATSETLVIVSDVKLFIFDTTDCFSAFLSIFCYHEYPVFAGLLFLVSLFFEGGYSSELSNMSLFRTVILMLKAVHVRATLSIIISNHEDKIFFMRFPLMPHIKAFNTLGDYWLLCNYFTQCVWLYHCS